jgi:hypothetical protein
MANTFPMVSCICPTYNRRRFLPYLLHIFDYQTWPKDRRELIILDDSPESNQDIVDLNKKDNKIKYIHSKERINLGKKRNMLNKMAKGEYIVCFDDDDYYPPDRIKNSINKMRGSKNTLSGCTILYVYYTSINKICMFGPYGPLHCTNGTMAYHRSFVKDHFYEDHATKAEEKFFLKDYTSPMIQLDPLSVMICISHDTNTFDKRRIMNTAKETDMKIQKLVKDKKLMEFYRQLAEETKNQPPPEPMPMSELVEGQINLDAIEAGQVLVTLESINQYLDNALKQNSPAPVINRLEKIIKKMTKGEIKCFNPYDQQNLNLDKVLKGELEISKDFVNYMIGKMKKENNVPAFVLSQFEIIKKSQEDGTLKCAQVTAVNEFSGIEFGNMSNQIQAPNTSENQEQKQLFNLDPATVTDENIQRMNNLTDIETGRLRVPKSFPKFLLENAKVDPSITSIYLEKIENIIKKHESGELAYVQ